MTEPPEGPKWVQGPEGSRWRPFKIVRPLDLMNLSNSCISHSGEAAQVSCEFLGGMLSSNSSNSPLVPNLTLKSPKISRLL